jgi:CheY-like chemotaxis protein
MAESDLALLSASYLRPSLILLDYLMPLMDGLQLYDCFQESEIMRGVPVVLISASRSLPYAQLQQRGIRALRKPLVIPALLRIIEELLALETDVDHG